MFFPPFDEKNSRYERKFLVSNMQYHDIEQQIRVHPSAFSPIFYPRYINNIYFDSHELDFFYDNIMGKGSRKKVRIRWYGEKFGFIEKPILEFKVREGMLGNKISFALKPFRVDETLDVEKLSRVFRESGLPVWAREILFHLRPSLLNRYRRSYFMSFDKNFRLTLDHDLGYYGLSASASITMENYHSVDVIVELKYEKKVDDQAAVVSGNLPFRLTKSSKYVNGIELLHPTLC